MLCMRSWIGLEVQMNQCITCKRFAFIANNNRWYGKLVILWWGMEFWLTKKWGIGVKMFRTLWAWISDIYIIHLLPAGGNYRSTTHVLCQLKFPEETHGMSCEILQTYAGGKTHKLLTRNAIMATESRENLVFLGDEAKRMVNVSVDHTRLYKVSTDSSWLQKIRSVLT